MPSAAEAIGQLPNIRDIRRPQPGGPVHIGNLDAWRWRAEAIMGSESADLRKAAAYIFNRLPVPYVGMPLLAAVQPEGLDGEITIISDRRHNEARQTTTTVPSVLIHNPEAFLSRLRAPVLTGKDAPETDPLSNVGHSRIRELSALAIEKTITGELWTITPPHISGEPSTTQNYTVSGTNVGPISFGSLIDRYSAYDDDYAHRSDVSLYLTGVRSRPLQEIADAMQDHAQLRECAAALVDISQLQ